MSDRISLAVNQERDAELFQAKLAANTSLAVTLIAFATFAFEMARSAYQWLRYGEAQTVTLATLFGTPVVGWAGVQKIIVYVWECQLLFVACVLMFVIGWIHGLLDDVVSDLKKKPRLGLNKRDENL